jgi:hypothetical protein
MQDNKITEEDLMSHVDKVVKALEKSGAADLAGLANKLSKLASGKYTRKYPFPLVGNVDFHGQIEMTGSCMLPCRFTHFVLSPETSKSFELCAFILGNDYQGVTFMPIPLETFSIEYMNDDRLASCQEWATAEMEVGAKFIVQARLRESRFDKICTTPAPEFRGLLWAEVKTRL